MADDTFKPAPKADPQQAAQDKAAKLEADKQAYIEKKVAEANAKDVPGAAEDNWKPS